MVGEFVVLLGGLFCDVDNFGMIWVEVLVGCW